MPKTAAPSIAESMQQQINEIENAIAHKVEEIALQDGLIAEYAEAIRVLQAGVSEYIAEGAIAPLDALRTLLRDAESEEERQHKWAIALRSLQESQQAAATLRRELEGLRSQLADAESEQDWLQNYQPHAEKYRGSFHLRSASEEKEQKVIALRKDIAEKRQRLGRGNSSVFAPMDDAYLTQAIQHLERQLQNLIDTPVAESKTWEVAFRRYVRSRVAVADVLNELIEVQSAYAAALQEFKAVLKMHPEASQITDIPDPRLVQLDNGRIVLSEPKLKHTPYDPRFF